MDICSEESKNKFLLAYTKLNEIIQSSPHSEDYREKLEVQQLIKNYGTKLFDRTKTEKQILKAHDIKLKNYSPTFIEKGFYFFLILF